jgi:hypothetical protein
MLINKTLMTIFLVLSSIVLLSSCNSFFLKKRKDTCVNQYGLEMPCPKIKKLKATNISYCVLLDSILSYEPLQKIIALSKSPNSAPIRFLDIDKKKNYINCMGLLPYTDNYQAKKYMTWFVVPQLDYYLNTGQFRDIVIIKYQETKKNINITLIASNFNLSMQEGLPCFDFSFRKIGKDAIAIDTIKLQIYKNQVKATN